jgi:hypothetical protein
MRRLRPLLCLLLLAVWLPATQYCGLRAAGLFPTDGCAEDSKCDCPPGSPCEKDNCKSLEQNLEKPCADSLGITCPPLVLCTCHLCLRLVELSSTTESLLPLERRGEPFDWNRTWQFRLRAAPMPRSPSLV